MTVDPGAGPGVGWRGAVVPVPGLEGGAGAACGVDAAGVCQLSLWILKAPKGGRWPHSGGRGRRPGGVLRLYHAYGLGRGRLWCVFLMACGHVWM